MKVLYLTCMSDKKELKPPANINENVTSNVTLRYRKYLPIIHSITFVWYIMGELFNNWIRKIENERFSFHSLLFLLF